MNTTHFQRPTSHSPFLDHNKYVLEKSAPWDEIILPALIRFQKTLVEWRKNYSTNFAYSLDHARFSRCVIS